MSSSCNSSLHPSTSVSHSDYYSDCISVDSWKWTSTLNSSLSSSQDNNIRNSNKEETEMPKKLSLSIVSSRKQWMLLPIENNNNDKKKTILSFKKVFKKGITLLSSSIRTLKWRQVYEIQHKQSINFLLNPVNLITYQRIDDRINAVDYVLNCLCNSVQDVQELQKNPQQLEHLIPNNVNAVLEDVAFAMNKMERIAKAEEKKRNQEPGKRKKTLLKLEYVDAKSCSTNSMGLQTFQFIDYMGAPLCFITFFITLFMLSTIINFTLITKRDDITKFEYVGAKHNHKWGPHSVSYIQDAKEREKVIRGEQT